MNPNAPIALAALGECRLKPNPAAFWGLSIIALVGAVASLATSFRVDDPVSRFLNAWLVAFAFVLSISLGATFFVLIQHLTRAGWGVVVRRLAEFLSINIAVVALLFLPIAWSVWQGDGKLYIWAGHGDRNDAGHENLHAATNDAPLLPQKDTKSGEVHASPANLPPAGSLTHQSASQRAIVAASVDEAVRDSAGHGDAKPWLNNSRFLATWLVLFVIWIGVAAFYFRQSVTQDRTDGLALTKSMEWWSGPATLLLGFTLTIGAFDLLMSLSPMWFSTIFGVYFFAGCAIAAFASLLLSVLLLRKRGLIPNVISDEVQRDLGRLMFAFVFFWGYIAFSQYMLLWYAHMPETTSWLVRRGVSTATGYTNSWGALALLLLFVHFVIPMCGLMSRHVKSNADWMIFWCIWMLIAHYLDLYWIIIPERHGGLTISLLEISTALSVISVYGLSLLWIASRTNLFAAGDPRMEESLTYHGMY